MLRIIQNTKQSVDDYRASHNGDGRRPRQTRQISFRTLRPIAETRQAAEQLGGNDPKAHWPYGEAYKHGEEHLLVVFASPITL